MPPIAQRDVSRGNCERWYACPPPPPLPTRAPALALQEVSRERPAAQNIALGARFGEEEEGGEETNVGDKECCGAAPGSPTALPAAGTYGHTHTRRKKSHEQLARCLLRPGWPFCPGNARFFCQRSEDTFFFFFFFWFISANTHDKGRPKPDRASLPPNRFQQPWARHAVCCSILPFRLHSF